MQNTLTFLNKFFWWIIALLGAMLFIWWLVFSPLFQSATATTNSTASSSSSNSSSISSSVSSTAVNSSSAQSVAGSTSSSSTSSSSTNSVAANNTNLIPTSQKGKYVKTFINGDEGYLGVNFRKTPCGELVGNYKTWNLKGTVNIAPTTDNKCALGKYTWYFVEFEDNTKGWVVENNLDFSVTK